MDKTTWAVLGAAVVWGVDTYALAIVPFGKRGSVERYAGAAALGAVAGYLFGSIIK